MSSGHISGFLLSSCLMTHTSIFVSYFVLSPRLRKGEKV